MKVYNRYPKTHAQFTRERFNLEFVTDFPNKNQSHRRYAQNG